VCRGCLPPDTIWHWAAYQQLLQYGLLAPIVEAAAARKLDLAGAWQGAVRDLVTGHKEVGVQVALPSRPARGACLGALGCMVSLCCQRYPVTVYMVCNFKACVGNLPGIV
jgi:hypothetical protein